MNHVCGHPASSFVWQVARVCLLSPPEKTLALSSLCCNPRLTQGPGKEEYFVLVKDFPPLSTISLAKTPEMVTVASTGVTEAVLHSQCLRTWKFTAFRMKFLPWRLFHSTVSRGCSTNERFPQASHLNKQCECPG